jgi:signal peptidase II
LFSDSFGRIAEILPKGGGYAGFMQGDVVDMLRFPLYHGILPNWVPFWGGQYFEFFNAIFNISDAAIFVGVVLIVIFQKPFFKKDAPPVIEEPVTPSQTEENPSSDPHSVPA